MAERRRFKVNPTEEHLPVAIIETQEPVIEMETPPTQVSLQDLKDVLEQETAGRPVLPIVSVPPPVEIPVDDHDAMEHGCRKLLEYLPEETRELVQEAYQSMPELKGLWMLIAGYIMRCRESGMLFHPEILPDWQEMRSPNSLRACKTCGQLIQPRFWSQVHCCNRCTFGKHGHGADCTLKVD